MTDEQVYKEIKKYFCIEEFVSPTVHKRHGERAWKFIDPRLLHTILIIRKTLDKSITINNWKWGGKFSQRGLRSNLGYIFLSKFKKGRLYLSAHVMGRAVDFDVKGMTAIEVRAWLIKNSALLPYKVRLEWRMKGKEITWCHLDMFWEAKNSKVEKFDV